MNVNIFVILITICAILSSLFTEGVKKFLDGINKKYSSNIVAVIVAIIVSVFVAYMSYSYYNIPFNSINICAIIALSLFTACGSMIGYDKVKQAIEQIVNLKIKGE